ncbi:uncharacterized protein OCT59_002036 [Rhizophagus irregularis]|uniref:Uncharacterized protein n=2 Tax=Rhizophagus irregularis TaxID=588596 RepID=U9TI46_RHIID|nr:hypothetical protein GLOIN_2v1473457 [Rhizophagus irregularis DAOM 181602=DAOM 197198]EXX51726.1 hypothetical protein RirG_259230 [Rhizophagus irregularis DAOM 197198w]POG78134.1 hypothetical protein GLOIN_2v1473457 [Rhizophagus irregularis DAOM 181602=DAOM 197198]UZO10454.1 hypothetical protein OCT59_002036 [Rhizophagus irregularis]GBC47373.1 hypothetical protein GLOIN_2v1473457 [Rhizophagus irregularis DAOM 181602=DAOM 197198]|eukprot:XP_025185000.1 hypothetical protein GLOIN_2v1473457 [Rhizophagus irregularis DAOM 181602=DAOM 197198]
MKNDYNFQTLRFPGKSQRKPKISKNAETSRTVISIQPLSKEIKSDVGLEVAYDFNIPADLLPFVLDGPIYTSKKQKKNNNLMVPGSQTWLTELKSRKKLHILNEKQHLEHLANVRKVAFLGICINRLRIWSFYEDVFMWHLNSIYNDLISIFDRCKECTMAEEIADLNQEFNNLNCILSIMTTWKFIT